MMIRAIRGWLRSRLCPGPAPLQQPVVVRPVRGDPADRVYAEKRAYTAEELGLLIERFVENGHHELRVDRPHAGIKIENPRDFVFVGPEDPFADD